MTNEDAKVFLDNLKICINEHPVVADWLVEIANRKTEPSGYNLSPVDKDINVRSNSSEKPNNCEDCRNWNHNYGACTEFECNYEPNNFDKDTNVRSKDEPQINASQHVQHVESVETMSCQECRRWIYDDRWGWFCPLKGQDECKYEPKDEPRTERKDK